MSKRYKIANKANLDKNVISIVKEINKMSEFKSGKEIYVSIYYKDIHIGIKLKLNEKNLKCIIFSMFKSSHPGSDRNMTPEEMKSEIISEKGEAKKLLAILVKELYNYAEENTYTLIFEGDALSRFWWMPGSPCKYKENTCSMYDYTHDRSLYGKYKIKTPNFHGWSMDLLKELRKNISKLKKMQNIIDKIKTNNNIDY